MTQNMPINPMELWSRALTEWETSMNSLANKGMKTDQFGRTMQKASTVAIEVQRHLDNANTKLLTAMNLPSRQQVEELGNRLATIEDMLRLLLEKSGVAPAGLAARPDEARPRRTRLPPSAKALTPPAEVAAPPPDPTARTRRPTAPKRSAAQAAAPSRTRKAAR